MSHALQLHVTDWQDDAHWRWVLQDARGNFLADHSVALDASDGMYRAFVALEDYLWAQTPIAETHAELERIGAWMGAHVFGGLAEKLRANLQSPATVVRMTVPASAQNLLFRPFEIAHLAGKTFAEWGVRFVYALANAPAPKTKPAGATQSVRVLAIYSLPDRANPLNVRRERYLLKHDLEHLAAAQGLALELRILQYGATRAILRDALEQAPGWDVIHFSGHGREGELLLETPDGKSDLIRADELVDLFRLTRDRLKLVTLSACLSAASVQTARAQIGLDALPTRADEHTRTALPSIAQTLSEQLDCAALAMRYPVGDDFSIRLTRGLYARLFDQRQALPHALQLALADATQPDFCADNPPLSLITPVLLGARAEDLQIAPPKKPASLEMPVVAGLANFEPEPQHFVGRLMPMLRASNALARTSDLRGVIFYGMAGAGKTSCALELAYRHERDRFQGYVWHKAPIVGADISNALVNFLLDIENQLGLSELALTAFVDEPAKFKARTLPRLREFLAHNAILICADNLESLLTPTNGWRDEKWGWLMDALLDHAGVSRVILTARQLPATLARHPRLQCEPIHALSFPESVLLARELPNLKKLFRTPAGLDLLQRTLNAIQGHPKLLDLANTMAADEHELAQALTPTLSCEAGEGEFFTRGETALVEKDFVNTLRGWTDGLTANLTPTARLLFQFLCRLEDPDRHSQILEIVWGNFLKRIESPDRAKMSDATELRAALDSLVVSGLLESRRIDLPADQPLTTNHYPPSTFRLHPAIAERGRDQADPRVLDAVDIELGNFWYAMLRRGRETEMQGGTRIVVESGKRGAPYLMRTRRWDDASDSLEDVVMRDGTPATLAFALPLLRQIVDATRGSELGLAIEGVLANTLLKAGRYDEAEKILRDLITKCVAQDNFRLASASAGILLILLRQTGKLQDALALSEQMAEYTRRAGLGPWTQLGDETRRLQILNALGNYREVLDAVQEKRTLLTTLPEKSAAEETANVWNVREALLDTGFFAARDLQEWQTALDLNAEIVEFTRARSADEVVIARKRFNDYGPLLRLRRYGEARALLDYCRAAFEQARAIRELGAVLSALADLEYQEGHYADAAQFERVALRYRYQAGQPEDCAISHNNLAEYLTRAGTAPQVALAHRLAAGVILLQSGSGNLANVHGNLANSALPDVPPTFEEVVNIVEQIPGVRFREAFARLPFRAPDGDSAIAMVLQMAREEQGRRRTEDEGRMTQVLQQFAPLLQAIANVARGDATQRAEIEQVLPKLESQGWQLSAPVARIWNGERDAESLTAGLDEQDAALVRRILELVGAT